jgi:hypothetical protein
LGKAENNEKAANKHWSVAALQGNALAMAGLALMHRDAGCTSTAIHWWERTLQLVALPEAACDIGVMHGKEGHDTPINYMRASSFYSHCRSIDSRQHKVEFASQDIAFVDSMGPNNDNQVEYQSLADSNLSFVKEYISNQRPAPKKDSIDLPPFVKSVATCEMCGKRPRQGEVALCSCSACKSVQYCNVICQRGHWQVHKISCSPPKASSTNK